MRLTRGEGWWLSRRRDGTTQVTFAQRLGISVDRLRRWEHDREASPLPTSCAFRNQPLTFGEYSALARRRRGIDLLSLALVWGISRQTLIKMEADRTRSARDLARWWGTSYPRPRSAAPVRIGAPAIEDRAGRLRRLAG